MSERKNGQPLPRRRARSRISSDVWEQTKTAYASGIGLREVARNMDIPEGTVLARAKREQWTQQVQSARALAKREDTPPAVTPMEAVAITLNERKDKTKLHLSRYAVEASEKAANHRQKLKIARQVKDVAAVAGSVWPAEKQEGPGLLVNIALLGIDPRTVEVRDTDAEACRLLIKSRAALAAPTQSFAINRDAIKRREASRHGGEKDSRLQARFQHRRTMAND